MQTRIDYKLPETNLPGALDMPRLEISADDDEIIVRVYNPWGEIAKLTYSPEAWAKLVLERGEPNMQHPSYRRQES